MANVLGIIAEYNPLHNGHLYHIKKAKENSNAEYIVAIMTGNFAQRGNVSVVNKWEKTKMALKSEVDLVIELPTIYSISSAENFADGAIKILNDLKLITYISFGLENDNVTDLNKIANILANEPEEFSKILKLQLQKGNSYPKARQNALIQYASKEIDGNLLLGSNNILAIEYLKAIKRQKANFIPIGIKREKVFYNSKKIVDEFASSTGIRKLLIEKQFDEISKVVPGTTFEILLDNIKRGTCIKDIKEYEKIIIYKLRTMTKSEITELPEVSEGLENLIKTAVAKTNNIYELINIIKSKRYTQTRIQRILLYTLIGITKQDMEMSKRISPYIRVLGCNKKGKELLSKIEKNKKVITSVKRFEKENINRNLLRILEIDRIATDIYSIAYGDNSKSGLDYSYGMIIE